MSVRTAELLMAILLALGSIGLMVKSSELSIGWIEGRGPGSGVWPFWLAVFMLLSCVAVIYRWFKRATPESRSNELYMTRGAVQIVGISVGALLALLIGTHLIGIYFSLFVFLFFYLRVLGRHSWTVTIPLTLATPVVLFLFFEWALKIPLPKAISEPLFYPIYDLIY